MKRKERNAVDSWKVELVVFDESDIDLKQLHREKTIFAWGTDMHEFLEEHFDLTKSGSKPLYHIFEHAISEIKGLSFLQHPLYTLRLEEKLLRSWSVKTLLAALHKNSGVLQQMAHKKDESGHSSLLVFAMETESPRAKRRRLNSVVSPKGKPNPNKPTEGPRCIRCESPSQYFDSALWKGMDWIFRCRNGSQHHICPSGAAAGGKDSDRHGCQDFLAYCFLDQVQLVMGGKGREAVGSMGEEDQQQVLESVLKNWDDLCERFPAAQLCWIDRQEINCPRCTFAMHGGQSDLEYVEWVDGLMNSFTKMQTTQSRFQKWWESRLEKALQTLNEGDPVLVQKFKGGGFARVLEGGESSGENPSMSEVGVNGETASAERQPSQEETAEVGNADEDRMDVDAAVLGEVSGDQWHVESADNEGDRHFGDCISLLSESRGVQSCGRTGSSPIEILETTSEENGNEEVAGPSRKISRWVRNGLGTGVELVVASVSEKDAEKGEELEIDVTSNSVSDGKPSDKDLEGAILEAYPLALPFDNRDRLQGREKSRKTCICCQKAPAESFPLRFENCKHFENHTVCLLSETRAVMPCILKAVMLWRISLKGDMSKVDYSKVKLSAPTTEERAYRMHASSMNSEWFNNQCPMCTWKLQQNLSQPTIVECLESVESRLRRDHGILGGWKFVRGL